MRMDKTKIYYNKKVKLNNPVLIVGLPGIGNVGALVGEHLRRELGAKRLATLYSPHFLHQVVMMRNGRVRLVSNRFYYHKGSAKNGNDVVILLGDMQAGTPEGQYEVNDEIVRFFKHIGGQTIYTIGGYSVGNQYIRQPRVFGAATDIDLITKMSKQGVIFGKTTGMIWGAAGLIVAFSKKHKLPAACIMGETGLLDIDANSAKAVLDALKRILGIDIDLENMEKIKSETEKMLKDLEEANKMMGGTEGQPPSKDNLTYIR